MKKALASVLSALMLITLGAGTVTATGNSKTGLGACTNEAQDYFGGVKVYARDKAKGASRVMCPATEEVVEVDVAVAGDREGNVFDRNLNHRNKNRPPLEDIWNGFHRNIESFKIRAAAGCLVGVGIGRTNPFLIRILDNRDGVVPKQKFYEIPRRLDNKTAKVAVLVECPSPDAP
jgi:hypothetical protein